jgi:hypothetical protein
MEKEKPKEPKQLTYKVKAKNIEKMNEYLNKNKNDK